MLRSLATAEVAMAGAGQLARMTHQAAISLGVRLHVLAERADDPAVLAGAPFALGSTSSLEDLRALARRGSVLTFDHELVPAAHLALLEEEGFSVSPPSSAFELTQDKALARTRLGALGFPVPPWGRVESSADVAAFAARHGWPVVLKAVSGGYDGRGVVVVGSAEEATAVLGSTETVTGRSAWIAERRVDIDVELAVLVARGRLGEVATYPVIQTTQVGGMCRELVMPAPIDPSLAARAVELGAEVVSAVGAVGIVAVELFVDHAQNLVVNELAMRPHNSGHATIEAAATSQFAQHLRAVLGWPLGSCRLLSPAAMVNVVGTRDGGAPMERLPLALQVPGVSVHLYAKAPRPGRKLGHVTALADDVDEALRLARRSAALLEGRAA
jgi:5-(carboxyamino)imidazole ribonucleotide synthase